MKRLIKNPTYLFLMLMVASFVVIVGLQVIIMMNTDMLPVENQALVEPSTSPILVRRSPTPTPTPTVTPAPPDIRLAYTPREVNCELVSEIVAFVLEEELGLDSEIQSYDSHEEMLAALVDKEADITFCFLDPEDRQSIRGDNRERFGNYLKQIGSTYWDTGRNRLQIWANAETRAKWRDEMPCLLKVFENVKFEGERFRESDAESWVRNHVLDVQGWVSCAP